MFWWFQLWLRAKNDILSDVVRDLSKKKADEHVNETQQNIILHCMLHIVSNITPMDAS